MQLFEYNLEQKEYSPSTGEKCHEKGKKYDTISYETRQQLIERVTKGNQKVSDAALQMGIKLSTAKFIVRSFKRSGKIFKKKTSTPQCSSPLKLPQEETKQSSNKEQQIKYIYYPIYVLVPCSSPPQQESKTGFKPFFLNEQCSQ